MEDWSVHFVVQNMNTGYELVNVQYPQEGCDNSGDIVGLGFDVYDDVTENIDSGAKREEYVADIGFVAAGAAVGSIVPGAGTLVGAIIVLAQHREETYNGC